MAVPDFQQLMFPVLSVVNDGQDHRGSEIAESVAGLMGLSDADLAELLPSGRQTKFRNRVAWAIAYLAKAAALERTGRGRYRLADRGRVLLGEPGRTSVGLKDLQQFPEFQDFNRARRVAGAVEARDEPAQTPEETLQATYQDLRRSLAGDLLDLMTRCSPTFFEKLVVDLLVAMGYGGTRGDAQAVGRGGDGGIDGIIKEDKLGLDVIYVQAKRWKDTVGRPVVQGFAGSLEGQRARKGVLITTSQFSTDALEYVKHIEKKIVLIDGQELAQLMIDYGIGVTDVETYTVKRIDQDYFEDE